MPFDHADDPVVTRSEEQLHVTTRRVRAGRALVRKTVVVEERTITVEVRHQEAHLEIVPFDSEQPDDGDDQQAAHVALPEFVLYREEIAIVRRLVPVERVRLDVQQVTQQHDVSEQLRKERITFDDGSVTADSAAGPGHP